MSQIDASLVKHIAHLAQIPVASQEEDELVSAFKQTLKVVSELKKTDVENVKPTHQVTGLTNVTRTDEINSEQMFTQEEALANASRTHDGFFVVERVIDEK